MSTDIDSIAELLAGRATIAAPETGERPRNSEEDRFSASQAFRFAMDRFELYRSDDGLTVAVPREDGGPRLATEVKGLRGKLMNLVYDDCGKVIGKDVAERALTMMAARADGLDPVPVGLRSFYDDAQRTVFLDLGDSTGRVVRVTADGWTVESPSEDHPLFRRNSVLKPLPEPQRNADADRLRGILKLEPGDPRWTLIRGWLAVSLFAGLSRPILWAQGPQGSGKSTRARMVHNIIEPRRGLGAPIVQERDAATAAKQRFFLSFDNVSAVSRPVSDFLCRLVTGAEDERREQYSDDTLRSGFMQRTAIATSIAMPNGLQADAVERLVKVNFQRMPESARLTEAELWGEYDAAHGELLGAVLDDVSRILRYLPEIEARKDLRKARMADYDVRLMALDVATGSDGADDGFSRTYQRTVSESLADRALKPVS